MSVQTQIDRISGAVSAALTALAEKGVEVPAGTKVDGLAALIAAIESGGGAVSGDCIPFEKNFTYSVDPIPNASYGFALNDNGYYESQNKGVKTSYAICRINLEVFKETDLTFNVINYAESNYDYGLLGNLDTALTLATSEDSNVKQSFKGMQSPDIVYLTYENVSVGNHFIDVKFIKDSSGDKDNDSIQFAVKETYHISEEYYPIIRQFDDDLTPENILSGIDIFGVIGTAIGGANWGTVTFDNYTQTFNFGVPIPEDNFFIVIMLDETSGKSFSGSFCYHMNYRKINGQQRAFWQNTSSSSANTSVPTFDRNANTITSQNHYFREASTYVWFMGGLS